MIKNEDIKIGARVIYDDVDNITATIMSVNNTGNYSNLMSFDVHYDGDPVGRDYTYTNANYFTLVKSMKEKYIDRSIKIIEKGGTIILKKNDGKTYLHQHTNIAAGLDAAHWTYSKRLALEIYTLEWAFALAPLYDCKVVVRYSKKKV